jgi:hypothetical protein
MAKTLQLRGVTTYTNSFKVAKTPHLIHTVLKLVKLLAPEFYI